MFLTPPSSPSLGGKPHVPFCLSEYNFTGKHTCEDWQINGYLSEVDSYIDQLNQYIQETRRFAEEAIQFANDAADHAQCEAEEVRTQHE